MKMAAPTGAVDEHEHDCSVVSKDEYQHSSVPSINRLRREQKSTTVLGKLSFQTLASKPKLFQRVVVRIAILAPIRF